MSATAAQVPIGEVMAVRPGDPAAASEVDGWLNDYTTNRDPNLRERIILAYLGLADRLADRYRHSRGTTPEDLRQTARAGLIAAVDRYDPDHGNPFVPYALACVVGEKALPARHPQRRVQPPGSPSTPPTRCGPPIGYPCCITTTSGELSAAQRV